MTTPLSRRAFAGAGLAGLAACARALPARAAPADAIGVVSPPNPHVFPLLLALARDPDLPVRLLPIAESRDADTLLQSGEASAMLAMSYIAAKKRMTGAVPDLTLYSLNFWRGFFQVAGEDVRTFADLRGQRLVVSGPIGNGQGGGGDIIFQAAARRAGLDPAIDFDVTYMPLAEGSAAVARGEAAAITVPSPGSTGMVMRAELAIHR
jgi:ABC-type nitrate/sulfonate/bicarbonate transport system substrate-binding protein